MIIVQILASLLMLFDTYQTVKILKHEDFIEGNPIINLMYQWWGMYAVLTFKIGIAIAPLFYFEMACIMLPLYAYIVYHNHTGFKEYNEANTNLH